MSDENDENEFENGEENENGNGNEKIQFRKKDGIEKDGYICFPVDVPQEEVEEEEEQEDETPPPPVKFDLSTCPEDPRYQQTNKTKWCYRMYIDYQRCQYLLGEGARQCDYFYRCYNSICPNAWHEKWDDQLKAGTFPRDITRDLPPPPDPPCL